MKHLVWLGISVALSTEQNVAPTKHVCKSMHVRPDVRFSNSWVSRDVTSFAQISVHHVGVPRVSNLC